MRNSISKLSVVLFFTLLFCAAASAQKLSAEEQKITNYVDANQDAEIALLERVVNIESPTENLAGVKQIGFQCQVD
ncbi:MAG: hypothetical protein ABR556_14315 [Pyrinomonadaceae bacterium]